jgi:hypothetical protein
MDASKLSKEMFHEMNICFKDTKIKQFFLFVCAVVFKVFYQLFAVLLKY